MKKLLQWLVGLTFMSIMVPALAVRVDSIYLATIPVATQTAQEKNDAIQQGLADVLVKVSGNPQILDNSKVKARLQNAGELVQEFSYAPSKSNDPKYPYVIHLRYDPNGINHLLQETGAAIWGKNRPLILGWVEYEGFNHPAEIIDSDSPSETHNLLKQHAEERGLPLIFPLMDVSEIGQVSTSDIVNMTIPTIQAASKRYDSDAILVGRIVQTEGGVTSQWRLQLGTEQWSWNVPGKTLEESINTAIDNVTSTLATRYATVVSNTVQTKILLRVTGVAQQNDLLQLMQYIQKLTAVSDVQLVQVNGDEVTLNVSLNGTKQSFTQMLALGKVLEPRTLTPPPDDDTLAYKWIH